VHISILNTWSLYVGRRCDGTFGVVFFRYEG